MPVGLLQAATFAGAAQGANLARDIEAGWFDRLLVCPAPRPTLLAGMVAAAALRSLLPTAFLLGVALLLGVHWPGVDGLGLALALELAMAGVAACWGIAMALRFRTQQAGPFIQLIGILGTLFSTAYAPKELLSGWLHAVATINPVTYVLEGARQGFVGGLTWADTWPAVVSVLAMLAAFSALALRGLRRFGVAS